MIQSGMMFGGEGPVMNGTWYNPNTGDAFTVRDSFFEDNQYVVTTTDGRYFRYDQLKNYIQSDMKLEDLKNIKNSVVNEELPPEVSNLIDNNSVDQYNDLLLPDDEIYTNNDMNKITSFGNINKAKGINNLQNSSAVDSVKSAPQNVNSTIIEKALKNTAKPSFSIIVNWPDYPEKQIEMLKDIMDIPVDEIVYWYLDNIQFNDFINEFKNAIENRICVKDNIIETVAIETLNVDDEVSVIEEVKETPKKPKRASNKKKE